MPEMIDDANWLAGLPAAASVDLAPAGKPVGIIAQGYLYAHPLASEDAAQFLRERSGLGLPAPASAAAATFDPMHAT
jgi:hypothetical protein